MVTKIEKKIVGYEVVKQDDRKDAGETVDHPQPRMEPLRRPEQLQGTTYKIKPSAPYPDHALYITINDIVKEDGSRQPLEIFINSRDMAHYEWTIALTRVLSAIFRLGLNDYSFIANELKAVFSPMGGFYPGKGSGLPVGRQQPSLVAAIGFVLGRHLEEKCGLIEPGLLDDYGVNVIQHEPEEDTSDRQSVGAMHVNMALCPSCQQYALVKEGGCERCTNCSYDKCS